MRRAFSLATAAAAALLALVPGCDDPETLAASKPGTPWYACQGSEQAFVRRAHLAFLGKRPEGQAAVNAWTDLLTALAPLDGPPAEPHPLGNELPRSRQIFLKILASDPDYGPRWLDFYRDALRVQRLDVQSNAGCYGTSRRAADPALVALVRDLPPDNEAGDGGGFFTMHDLLASSLLVDDISPAYTANLFAMMARSYTGANADPVRRELARRGEFGAWFGASYLHRDIVCLGCHNSEFSVTSSPDPATNRHFPLPGRLEEPLFGLSSGPAPENDHDGATRMQAVLRYSGLADTGGGLHPWGMAFACGDFVPQDKLSDDPAQVDAKFGDITGHRASVWGLAASLQRGFSKLRQHGLTRGPDGQIPDPDEAFAYLVSANIAERVWREVIGSPLTIALYFPRNQASLDQLSLLTEGFIASGFSHQRLLQLVLQSPAFNLAPPAACGPDPYAMPALFDAWTTAESDPARRGNGPGDGVASMSSRTLLRATRAALGWSALYDDPFPLSRDTVDADFQAEIGVFLRNVEPGFQGFDFQALLAWEHRTGSCKKPPGSTLPRDLVDQILDEAEVQPGATVADAVLALKDRLLGEPAFSSEAEKNALVSLLGPLDAPATSLVDDAPLRAVCGAMLSSPAFLLSGLAPPDTRSTPRLTPEGASYRATCQRIAKIGLPDGMTLSCGDDSLHVAR